MHRSNIYDKQNNLIFSSNKLTGYWFIREFYENGLIKSSIDSEGRMCIYHDDYDYDHDINRHTTKRINLDIPQVSIVL